MTTTIRTIRKGDLIGSARHVKNDHYETVRFLLASDGIGLTLTDITLSPDKRGTYGYDDHLELAYCLSGRAEIVDLGTGLPHVIEPGVLWIAPKGSRFEFLAFAPTRLICVFTPAFVGNETGFARDQ